MRRIIILLLTICCCAAQFASSRVSDNNECKGSMPAEPATAACSRSDCESETQTVGTDDSCGEPETETVTETQSAAASEAMPTETTACTQSCPATTARRTQKPTYTEPQTVPTSARPVQTTTAPRTTAVVTTAAPRTTAAQTTAFGSDEARQVLGIVNSERAKNGLPPLSYRDDLQSAANIRANEIINRFSHTRPNGSSCFTAVSDAGIPYRTVGENIAYGYRNAQSVMDGWLNSSGHRANILNGSFTGLAVGVAERGGVKYWVQIFIG